MSKVEANPSSAALFAALGDPTRLALVERLADGGERSICVLADGLPMSRQAVRKHLAVLEDAGLVRRVATGRERHFLLAKKRIEEARAYLDDVARQWDDALSRLKEFVED